MRGRKPKPTTLKLLAGNPGHRPLNGQEALAPAELPDCPDHLDKDAQAEWQRISPILVAMNLLSSVDRAALAAYCVLHSRWISAERAVQKFGMVVKSPNKGFPMKSPYLCIAESSLEQMRKFLVEFGLTPSSRSRIRVDQREAAGSLDEFLSRRA